MQEFFFLLCVAADLQQKFALSRVQWFVKI